MRLNKKTIAAKVLGIGKSRVWFDNNRLEEIKKALTRGDIRILIKDRAIQARPEKGTSRARARKLLIQKRKGRRSGIGSRKGKHYAGLPRKEEWINRIRALRYCLQQLRRQESIDSKTFRTLYKKCKGGLFRSKRHLLTYLAEHSIIKPQNK